ncbi:GD13878 [Drosophila simulans]|uniref:GD13878 n=1 Tax=Drosophila simulans TaxID=7240 RepID=B4QRI4_DROSI|nr:GD13878 [Drosophila simulans]
MFNNIFGKNPTVKEQQRENDRSLRKATRDIERERRKMEEEERKLELEIRRNAAAGNNDACRILAKQLVEIRKQKSRTYAAAGKIQSIGYQNKNMGANIALSEAMGTTAKTMGEMNKSVDIQVQFAQLRQSRVHILLLATADDHCGAIFGQPFGNRETNAGGDSPEFSGGDPLQFLLSCLPIGGGGDHGYFPCQTLHRAGCRTLTTAGQTFVALIEIRANEFWAVIVAVLIET